MTRFEDTLKDLRAITLPTDARARMREELMAYADMHATVSAPTPSPFQSFFSMRLYAGFAAFLLVIGGLGGTAYASERALPGDKLYAVKVGLTEPIQTALIPTNTGKAAWHAILAERRLEEAALLASENKLSTETQAMLAANFSGHVEESVAHAEELAAAGDTFASLSVRSDLEARLVAHEQILGVIAGHFAHANVDGIRNTSEAVETLLAVVKDRGETVALARADLEQVIAPAADDSAAIATTMALKVANEADIAEPAAMAISAAMTGEAQVELTENAREQEVQSILMRHAGLLAKFASTTATTTQATTTEPVAETSTTTEVRLESEIKIRR